MHVWTYTVVELLQYLYKLNLLQYLYKLNFLKVKKHTKKNMVREMGDEYKMGRQIGQLHTVPRYMSDEYKLGRQIGDLIAVEKQFGHI